MNSSPVDRSSTETMVEDCVSGRLCGEISSIVGEIYVSELLLTVNECSSRTNDCSDDKRKTCSTAVQHVGLRCRYR